MILPVLKAPRRSPLPPRPPLSAKAVEIGMLHLSLPAKIPNLSIYCQNVARYNGAREIPGSPEPGQIQHARLISQFYLETGRPPMPLFNTSRANRPNNRRHLPHSKPGNAVHCPAVKVTARPVIKKIRKGADAGFAENGKFFWSKPLQGL